MELQKWPFKNDKGEIICDICGEIASHIKVESHYSDELLNLCGHCFSLYGIPEDERILPEVEDLGLGFNMGRAIANMMADRAKSDKKISSGKIRSKKKKKGG